MQGPVIMAPPQPPPHTNILKYLAIAQVTFIGLLTAILGLLARTALGYLWVDIIGTGIWTGGWIIITGIIGITSTRNYMNTNGSFTKIMVFNIISAGVSGVTGLFFLSSVFFYANYYCPWDMELPRPPCYWVDTGTGLGVNIALLILMVLNFIISIVCAALCCRCCGQGNTPGQVVIQQPAVFPTGQVAPQYVGQMPPPYGNQFQPVYLPQQMNYSQYPPQQPNNIQYPPQQGNVIQYPPQQQNVTQYPPQQSNGAQYPSQQPISAQQQKAEA